MRPLPRLRHTAPALAALLMLLAPAAEATGQAACSSMEECPGQIMDAGPRQELTVAGVNALLGGATAAAGRLLRGDPAPAVWSGFWAGFVGGGAVHVGKRVVVEEFAGAGFLGREIASVGSSVIRNAAAGRSPLSELVLPVGPVRVYVSGDGVVPRLDLATVATAGAFMAAYGARLDAGASLSAGALVLRGDAPMPGLSSAGAILTWRELPASEGPRLMAHERVHVLQYDQAFLSWTEPAERWLAPHAPLPRSLLRHIDTGGLALGMRLGLNLTFDYGHRPWEQEAYLMSQIAHPVPPIH